MKNNKAASDLKLWKQCNFHKETSNLLQNKGTSETLKIRLQRERGSERKKSKAVSGKVEVLIEDAEHCSNETSFPSL